MTSLNKLLLGPSPSASVTENLASLPDYALRELAETTDDINVVRMVAQELYLRLELRAYTDLEPTEDGTDEDDYPASLTYHDYETSLVRARKESARGYPYGSY